MQRLHQLPVRLHRLAVRGSLPAPAQPQVAGPGLPNRCLRPAHTVPAHPAGAWQPASWLAVCCAARLRPSDAQALVTLHGLHGLAVFCKLLSPALYNPFSGFRDWSSIILLNSFNLAVACRSDALLCCSPSLQGCRHQIYCSTYYSFCGNPVAHSKGTEGGGLKAAVCSKWLHPIDMREHPALASWVIYGAPACCLGAGCLSTAQCSSQLLRCRGGCNCGQGASAGADRPAPGRAGHDQHPCLRDHLAHPVDVAHAVPDVHRCATCSTSLQADLLISCISFQCRTALLAAHTHVACCEACAVTDMLTCCCWLCSQQPGRLLGGQLPASGGCIRRTQGAAAGPHTAQPCASPQRRACALRVPHRRCAHAGGEATACCQTPTRSPVSLSAVPGMLCSALHGAVRRRCSAR